MGDITLCQTELWVQLCHVTGIAKNFQLFKGQHRRQPIRMSYANTLAQTLANCIHLTLESNIIGCCHYDGHISTKLQTRPLSRADGDGPCECSVRVAQLVPGRPHPPNVIMNRPDRCLNSSGHTCKQLNFVCL